MMYPPQHSELMQAPAAPPSAPPPTAGSTRRRWVLWLVLGVVVVLGAAAGVAGYALTRAEPPAMAVGDCVSGADVPVEYSCADAQATYRIVARESAQWPFGILCMKYAAATRAVLDPKPDESNPAAALCLSPTRANTTDPGSLLAGDCVDVKKGGATIVRMTCGASAATLAVVAIEIHAKIPVTDQACKAHASTRDAVAQVSLGGRAVVVCARPAVTSTAMTSSKVGDCAAETTMTLAPCDQPGVRHRVLSVRTQHVEPVSPQCPDDGNVSAVVVNGGGTTDLRVVVCLGPANLDHLGYGKPGDCLIGFGGTGDSAPVLVDCADPAANATVSEVLRGAGAECPRPVGASGAFTLKPAASSGLVVCYVPL
ncbi:LppU/SCO3897 family protein [Nocardia sp. FBN12]|uniref:LppU/SCO3897 family protein n=1 Tax=Nocardia sp. FBN12 TaxID=3419766 RepID=UPI003D06B3E9